MIKHKPKVNVHGNEISLLEAKLLLLGLEVGLMGVNLNEEEKIEYSKWGAVRRNRNEISMKRVGEVTYKKINERKYFIESLKKKITSAKKEDNYNKYDPSFNPFSG